jgi:hypothetical protein
MDLSLFRQKDFFPSFVIDKLATVTIDYKEKHSLIQRPTKQIGPILKPESSFYFIINQTRKIPNTFFN